MEPKAIVLSAVEREALRGVIETKKRAVDSATRAEVAFQEVIAAILESRGLDRDDVIRLEDLDRGLVRLEVHPEKAAKKEEPCSPISAESSSIS